MTPPPILDDTPGEAKPAPVVRRWTGVEVRAVRHAVRMSLREFAAHLGVSDRMVSKWEAGGSGMVPSVVNQAALDTCLARASNDARERFADELAAADRSAAGPGLFWAHIPFRADAPESARLLVEIAVSMLDGNPQIDHLSAEYSGGTAGSLRRPVFCGRRIDGPDVRCAEQPEHPGECRPALLTWPAPRVLRVKQ
jgi:transcriptional regulator with XRE-family HTH domain